MKRAARFVCEGGNVTPRMCRTKKEKEARGVEEEDHHHLPAPIRLVPRTVYQ